MAIKEAPEDFVVEEELESGFLDALSPRPGPFALYQVRKRLLTTHELLDALARRLSAPLDDLAAAGLKDKQAVTTQHITLRIDSNRRLPPCSIEGDSYAARQLGFVPAAIDSKAIRRNRFEIVVRLRSRKAADELKEAAARFAVNSAAEMLVTNYFGNQRFGSARAGQGFIAAHLVRGNFEQALRLAIAVPHRKDERRIKEFKQAVANRWEARSWANLLKDLPNLPERDAIEHLARKPNDYRGAFAALPYFFQQLCVEAYQSLLWNRIATGLLVDRLGESGKLWIVDDTFGQIVFPEPDAIPLELLELDIPLLGRRTELQSPWNGAAARVLEEEQLNGVEALKITGLDKPWFGDVPRRLFMTAGRFQIGKTKADEGAGDAGKSRGRVKVTLKFTLPRGGYATVLLRALGQ